MKSADNATSPQERTTKRSEREIQNEIRLALGKRPDVFLWRNNTGMFETKDGRPTRGGLAVGSSDLIGIIAPLGKFLALEVKRPGAKATPRQEFWLGVVRQAGGIAAVVTSVAEAIAAVESALKCQQCKGEGYLPGMWLEHQKTCLTCSGTGSAR